ncbi:hypothetical protein JHK85_044075 [Glycine max]|nr:hypothetical protein JHK85_044075 [Glycine max]
MKILLVPFVVHSVSSMQKTDYFVLLRIIFLIEFGISFSLILSPCIFMPPADFKSSINSRVCKIIPIILHAF